MKIMFLIRITSLFFSTFRAVYTKTRFSMSILRLFERFRCQMMDFKTTLYTLANYEIRLIKFFLCSFSYLAPSYIIYICVFVPMLFFSYHCVYLLQETAHTHFLITNDNQIQRKIELYVFIVFQKHGKCHQQKRSNKNLFRKKTLVCVENSKS